MNVITKTVQLPDGRTITIETGKVAKQTDGSVMLRMNNTQQQAVSPAVSQSERERQATTRFSQAVSLTVCSARCSRQTIMQKSS